MPYQNRRCNYCGKKYYVCLACERVGSWKTICCSRECYYKLMKKNNDIVMP
nr:MAG TPA: CHC2 zinc finger protein [Caudoviricetes sp.]